MSNRLQVYNEFLFQLPRRLFSDEKEKLVLSDAERAAMKKQLESIRVEISAAELEYTREEVDGAQKKRAPRGLNRATASGHLRAQQHQLGLSLRADVEPPPRFSLALHLSSDERQQGEVRRHQQGHRRGHRRHLHLRRRPPEHRRLQMGDENVRGCALPRLAPSAPMQSRRRAATSIREEKSGDGGCVPRLSHYSQPGALFHPVVEPQVQLLQDSRRHSEHGHPLRAAREARECERPSSQRSNAHLLRLPCSTPAPSSHSRIGALFTPPAAAVLGILAPANPADPKWATSRKKRAADEAAAAAAAAGGASSGAGAGAGPGASAAAAAASPPAVKVKAEGAKRQRAADDEVVDLCD